MNLQKLFELQRKLDEHIERMHPRQDGEDRTFKKVLALLVEIGELANETRCFKFWSNKGPSPREKNLEEAADVLHFLLSVGNDIGVDKEYEPLKISSRSLDIQFLMLYEYARLAHKTMMWYATMDVFVGLVEMLGFTWEQVEEAYCRKNEINHQRQEQKY